MVIPGATGSEHRGFTKETYWGARHPRYSDTLFLRARQDQGSKEGEPVGKHGKARKKRTAVAPARSAHLLAKVAIPTYQQAEHPHEAGWESVWTGGEQQEHEKMRIAGVACEVAQCIRSKGWPMSLGPRP